jgi:tetratricopeptide (TPR) repeat protein
MWTVRDLADELLQAKVKTTLFGGDHAPRLGRLVIVDRIGAGAMGTVFAAYDPRLDRQVAVKLLRTAAPEQLLAEARALARLSHPNVVAIHDVGEEAGTVHLVMEHAPGVPLRAWMRSGASTADVLRVMREVGAGLAAAHRAGLIHRDIKPDNILIGDDRPRIVDFGLAHERASDDMPSAGTPGYMAPEVLAGGPATEASDQFSFGVTLFEALYGVRPYGGKTRDELAVAASTAADAKPPDGSTVPARVHAVVARALAKDPQARFPSMAALVAALADRRRSWVIAIASAALACGVAVGALAYHARATVDPCTGAADRRAPAWNDAAKAEVRGALAGAAWAPRTLDELDDTAARWEASYHAVCAATRVRGEQSDTLLDLRMRCLDRALDRFAALTTALAKVDGAAARAAAPSAIDDLPQPEACETLVDAGELSLPGDLAGRTRAVIAIHALDRAWALFALGNYRDARTAVQAVAPQLAALDAPAVRATSLALSASIEARTGSPTRARLELQQALIAAAAAHAPELELEVWSRTLRNELFSGNPAHVLEWAPFARAAAARAGRQGAEVDGVVAEAERDAEHFAHARELLDRALATTDPLRPAQRAILELNLGALEIAVGHSAAALAILERGHDRVRTALGYGHPELALYLDKLAEAKRALGKIRDALALHDHSLALRTAAFGDADRAIATSLFHRGETLLEAGELARARTDLERALAIRSDVYGPTSPRVVEILVALGDVAAANGERDAAAQRFGRAAAIEPRIALDPRRFAITPSVSGELGPHDTVPLSADRAAMIAAGTQRLVDANRVNDARDYASALFGPFEPAYDTPPDPHGGHARDPGFVVSVAAGDLALGERPLAAVAYADALARAGTEPTLTALHAAIGLALSRGDRSVQAARVAISLFQAMPQLARGADYTEIAKLAGMSAR